MFFTLCQSYFFVSTTRLNFVKFCRYEGHSFPGSYAPFELRNLTKIKYTTKIVCQCDSSETAEQNLLNFRSFTKHAV